MLRLFSHRTFRWFFGGLLTVPPCLLILGQLLGIFHPLDRLTITLILMLGWCGILVAVVLVAALRRQVNQAIVEAGPPTKYLAHWTYSEEEWQRFVRWSWQKGRYRAIRQTMVFFGGVLLLIVLLLIAGALNRITLAIWNDLLLLLGGTLGGLVLIAGLVLVLREYRRFLRRRQHIADVYITSSGVHWPDRFQSLQGLRKATFQPGPPAFLFCECLLGTGWYRKSWLVEVPVPEQHEAEAPQLLHRLLPRQHKR
jgi:hypothetical protein